ncbi:mannosyltransferase putative-domain-containing protein [Aspergillus lucknowensis]|uniref:Mannosyltransferase putative-domain-containing protein n=1 Tax=Aspergillus lucknowensis TaxID=176173 RepID=A0ABR4LRS5_9EURO
MLVPWRIILTSLLLALFLLHVHYLRHKGLDEFALPLPDRQAHLWQYLRLLLEQYAPKCPPPNLHSDAGVVQRFDAMNEKPRESYIRNADEIALPMQTAHDGFVDAILRWKVSRAYAPGTMGIVSSAGGTYLPTFVISLKMLRRTGSTLPVELFMKDWTEYEPYTCEVILPPLGVKCLVLSDFLTDQNDTRNVRAIEGFQIKSFAMLFSSFEKILWLDADCVPLYDPTPILISEPFTSTGLVTWPDFWANTAAPVYFNISRQLEPPSTARQATESGILLICKKTHLLTLLLSAYYNYYGPDYYYPLLDQGAPGAGDKDTFLHAATALNESFYSVSETVLDLGNLIPGSFQTAINAGYIQADPIQDYNLTSQGKWRVQDSSVAEPPRAFFIHAGDPEFNPGNQLMSGKLLGFDGNPTRLWTYPPNAIKRVGYDAEKALWEETVFVACKMEFVFSTWKDKTGICRDVQAHWRAVFLNSDATVPEFTDG